MQLHDRHKHPDCLKAELAARRILQTPSVVQEVRDVIDRFWRDDPHAARSLAVWDALLTRPPFAVTTARQVAGLAERLRREWVVT